MALSHAGPVHSETTADPLARRARPGRRRRRGGSRPGSSPQARPSRSAVVDRTATVDPRPGTAQPRPRVRGTAASCPLRRERLVCVHDAACACPLAGQLSDAERALVNDIGASAARLRAVCLWGLVLAAVVVTLVVLLG